MRSKVRRIFGEEQGQGAGDEDKGSLVKSRVKTQEGSSERNRVQGAGR